jgi:hypothetical protein
MDTENRRFICVHRDSNDKNDLVVMEHGEAEFGE